MVAIEFLEMSFQMLFVCFLFLLCIVMVMMMM